MTLRFLSDECFNGAIVRAMSEAGYDVVRSQDLVPGADDETVLQRAYDDGRILLTEDHDFGDLVVRLQLPTHGVVIVSLRGKALSADKQCERVLRCLAELGDQIRNSLVTIEPGRWRLRPIG